MKRKILSLFSMLALLFSLVSCGDPDPKEFTHCELTLLLDDSFEAEESEDFDLFLSNGAVAVSLIRLSFSAAFDQGILDTYTPKGFAAFFMHKSEKSDDLYMHGEVPYYNYTENISGRDIYYTVTFYRSYNAYFIVAYAVDEKNKDELSAQILQYAENAYFNDGPKVN